jgi:isopenicillin N synthase-like dioxygenase
MFRPVECNIGPPFDVGYGPNKWPSTPKDFRKISEKYIESVTSLGTNVDSQTDSLQVLAKTGEWMPANPIPVKVFLH